MASAFSASDGPGKVAVLIDTPGLCNVQNVYGLTPTAASRTLGSVNCQVGKISRVYSRWAKKGLVISQKPKFGAVLAGGGKVNLVVSKGKRR